MQLEFKYYTEKALADLLHVSVAYLQQQRNAGKIGCVRLGRSVRYTQEQIEEFIKSNSVVARKMGKKGEL